jgi:hypothetical protein
MMTHEKMVDLSVGYFIRVPKEGGLMVVKDQFARMIKGHDRGSIRSPQRRLRLA